MSGRLSQQKGGGSLDRRDDLKCLGRRGHRRKA